jgi:TP901 family phage tail tape measure protein
MAFKGIQVIINGIDKLSPVIDSPMKKLQKMGTAFSKIGKAATIGITLPILAAGVASAKSAIDLNASMANVATLIPETGNRIYALKDVVQALSMETGKATSDIAGGLYQVISAFGDSADTAKTLGINVKAAKAGISTTSDAILFTGAVTKAYGDTSAVAMQKVADLGFQTVKLGVTTFPELAQSIGHIAPLAQVMGVSLEELFGVMATVTGITGDTAAVSTQFAGILSAMVKPTTEMTSLFKFLGYNTGQAMIKELGFAKSLQTIVAMSEKASVSLGTLFGRKEAMILSMSLTGKQSADLAKKTDAMRMSAGALDQAFKAQTEGINKTGDSLERLKAKFIVLGQKVGDKLLPVLDSLLVKLSPILDKFINMQPEALQLIFILGGIAAVIGPLILLFSSVAY